MEYYVRRFLEYNGVMVKHFDARNTELEDLSKDFTMSNGEPSHGIGFQGYMERMRQDEEAMMTWKVAKDTHLKALRECEEIRFKYFKCVNKASD